MNFREAVGFFMTECRESEKQDIIQRLGIDVTLYSTYTDLDNFIQYVSSLDKWIAVLRDMEESTNERRKESFIEEIEKRANSPQWRALLEKYKKLKENKNIILFDLEMIMEQENYTLTSLPDTTKLRNELYTQVIWKMERDLKHLHDNKL